MLQLFYGNNSIKINEALENALDVLIKSDPHLHLIEFEPENFSENKLEEAFQSQGLFGKTVIVANGLLADERIESYIGNFIENLAASPNHFFFVETSVRKKTLDRFKKHGAHISLSEEKESADRRSEAAFPVFSISDAVGARDKKKAWIILHNALEAGILPEQLHGIIHWQCKNMNLVKNSSGNAGLSPFVFTKTQKAVGNYSTEELKKMSSELVVLYHESHRGGLALDLALEKFVLTL